MGRKKVQIKKIENSACRGVTYSKRKDGILKKANELSILCDTDLGILMLPSHGRLTSFATKGRIEDVFLRYIEKSTDIKLGSTSTGNKEYLYETLLDVKHEGEMLDRIAKVKTLEKQLCTLYQKQKAALEKIRFCNPDPEKITSDNDAQAHKQYLIDAIERMEQLKANFFGRQTAPQDLVSGKLQLTPITTITHQQKNRTLSRNDYRHEESRLPMEQHLSLDYL